MTKHDVDMLMMMMAMIFKNCLNKTKKKNACIKPLEFIMMCDIKVIILFNHFILKQKTLRS